ncbi:MAG: hypothetical protein AAFZ07_17915 [Actinomycetota bacterium]
MTAVLLAHGNNLDEILMGGIPLLIVIGLVAQGWRRSRALEASEAGDD